MYQLGCTTDVISPAIVNQPGPFPGSAVALVSTCFCCCVFQPGLSIFACAATYALSYLLGSVHVLFMFVAVCTGLHW